MYIDKTGFKMINVYCTQKLLTKLPIKQGLWPKGKLLKSSLTEGGNNIDLINPLSGWHANLLTLQRRNCVLMVNNQSRFPVLMIGLTKPDFAALDYHFADCLMNTLLKVGANDAQMQTAKALLAPISINKSNDRSVQGTLNRMVADVEHILWFDNASITDCSPYKTAA
jgi:hypothetical protein